MCTWKQQKGCYLVIGFDLEMELVLLGQNHHVKHHSIYFKQHMGKVLLQPTEGFLQPSSACCSGQLTRLSISPCQSVDDQDTWLWGHTEVTFSHLPYLAVKINTHFVCLLGCSALPLGLKQTNCPCFSCTQTVSSRQGMVFHTTLTPAVGNSQQLQTAVVGSGRGYGNYHKNGHVW